VQNFKNLSYTKNSCQAIHIRPPSRISESGRTCPLAPRPDMPDLSAFSRVNQAYPTSRPDSKGISWTCPTPSTDMSDLTQFLSDYVSDRTYPVPNPISRDVCWTCLAPDPDMSGFLTPQWLDSLGGYKRPLMPL
jgi:hypothetical protein